MVLEYGLGIGALTLVLGALRTLLGGVGRAMWWLTGDRRLPPVREFVEIATGNPFAARFHLMAHLLMPGLRAVRVGGSITLLFALLLVVTS